MNRRFSIFLGIALISMGLLSLTFTLGMTMLGLDMWFWGMGRFWPLIVVGAGMFFVLPPFLVRDQRGLGALFIPGVPILVTGGILLFVSIFDVWDAWAWLWPLEVLALALGFLAAAIYTRWIWLVIPAIVIGLNGLVLQFCANTGLWEAWAVLWTVEPLAVGLSLLVVSPKTRIAGLIVCGLAGLALVGIATVLSGWWPASLLGAGALVLAGFLLLAWGMAGHLSLPRPATE